MSRLQNPLRVNAPQPIAASGAASSGGLTNIKQVIPQLGSASIGPRDSVARLKNRRNG
jgi:hypothetical protein